MAPEFTVYTKTEKPIRPKPAKGERSAEGGVWCMMILPLAGLFLEMYAIDKYAGIALWLIVIIMIYVCGIMDYRQIKDSLSAEKAEQLKKLLPIPPAYLFMRCKSTTGESYKGIVMGILLAAAMFSNGFVHGLMINEEKIIEAVEYSTASVFDNFSGQSDDVIEDSLKEWLGEDYTSACTRKGDVYTITFSGKHDGKPAEITVEVVHDGFVYKTVKTKTVKTDGKELEGDELKDTLYEIFTDEKPADESSTAKTDE